MGEWAYYLAVEGELRRVGQEEELADTFAISLLQPSQGNSVQDGKSLSIRSRKATL